MSTVEYMKNASIKVNKSWGHNEQRVSSQPGKYAYLSPFIREVCVHCKDLNVQLMDLLNNIVNATTIDNTTLPELNAYYPEILRTVIYDQVIYNNIITLIPSLCERYKRDGECSVEDCNYNSSNKK